MSVTTSVETPAQPGSALSILELLNEALARTADQRQEKKLTLQAELPERLPPIKAGRAVLLSAFTCLLSNAEDATPPYGQIGLRALVQLGVEGGEYVLIQVSDQGGGITPDDLQRIFSGLHSEKSPSMPGAGDRWVDLASVRSDIEALNGRVWVDSRSGVGTVFSILLPAAQEIKSRTGNKAGVSTP
jgi:signal transduction histidine kinase